jgi:hypothetical protein
VGEWGAVDWGRRRNGARARVAARWLVLEDGCPCLPRCLIRRAVPALKAMA